MMNHPLRTGAMALACGLSLLVAGVATAQDARDDRPLNIGGVDKPGGTVKGIVKFDGEQKARRPIAMAADPYCAKFHAAKPALMENYIFGNNNTLENVFVQVTKGIDPKDFPPPKEPDLIDQIGCMYVPHVSGVQVGQPLEILSSDNTLHNVKCAPQKNPGFNKGMPVKGMKLDVTFQIAETIRLQCDVHAWMNAVVHVVDNPFFAVTQDDGKFEIHGLPPGEYEISFSHEIPVFQADHPTMTVKVAEGETQEVTVTFAPRKRN